MKIGYLTLDNSTVFAPLAGITNLPMRLLAKEAGCGMVCSEMVSAHGLAYGSSKTRRLLESAPEEKPLSIQIFGGDWAVMADAAQQVESAGADVVDINCGCAVRKILKSGSGSDLMREPRRAAEIFKAVRGAVSIPMTVKMRSGWDSSGDQAVELARIAQACGADAVTIHPRTARQGFSGAADWSLIARIKRSVRIPVIGNGDIVTPGDARRMFRWTGCDAVMVGRAAFGNPLLFSQILDLLSGRPPREISAQDRCQMMRRYLKDCVRCFGEKNACYMMRGRLGWFVKGLPRAASFRRAIRHLSSERQALRLIDDYWFQEADFGGHGEQRYLCKYLSDR